MFNLEEIELDILKEAVYDRFRVSTTRELKDCFVFLELLESDGYWPIGDSDFRRLETWKDLYRKFVEILPGEDQEEGYGCINGINIFKYFRPWRVFNLDSKTATQAEIRTAYCVLVKVYHPDNQETGDREIFDRIQIMYRSINNLGDPRK
jgi:DnaJ domain